MKKLFVLLGATLLVAAFTLPAIGADWDMYGSVRMGYWRFDADPGGNAASNSYSRFRMNDNSRIGAKIKDKAKKITGHIELGVMREAESWNAASATNEPRDNRIWARIVSAKWDFGAGKLMAGLDYTPLSGGTTSMAGMPATERWDEALGYWGPFYDGRQAQVRLEIGGLQVALIHDHESHNLGTGGTSEITIPKIGASYEFKLDPVSIKLMGAYLSYDIRRAGALDLDVEAYGGGVLAKVKLGPVNLQGVVHMAVNSNELGMANRTDRAATLDATGNNVVDNDTLAYNISGSYRLNDMIQFGAGYGYSETESDAAGAIKDEEDLMYLQAVITLSPGVYVVPEIGIQDMKNNAAGADQGDKKYYGAKLQIDF